jgi:hypothetical protein
LEVFGVDAFVYENVGLGWGTGLGEPGEKVFC